MKTKTLLFLLLFVCSTKEVHSTQLQTEATLKEIQIRSTPRLSPRSTTMKSKDLTSSTTELAPNIYLIGATIAVNFVSSTTNASIVVTNTDTGEVVHHELFSCSSSTTVLVDLQGCQSCLYYIDIMTSSTYHSGEFVL